MNWLFRFFVALGALIVVLLFSALLAPYFVDWERFTSEFERQTARIIGQPVTVGGKSNLRLLPLPYISFEDLEVGRNEDGSPLMTVERFSLYAELMPFLSGEVRIVEVSMDRPQVNLQVAENGTIAWTTPTQAMVNPEQVNIERLTVNNGAMEINGLTGGRSLSVDNLQGVFSARSVVGPWRIEADADIEGIASSLSISTGTYQPSAKSVRLRIEATRKDQPYRLALDGPVRLEEAVLKWGGKFEFTPQGAGSAPSDPRALPVRADGAFSASPQRIEVEDYRMEIGSQEDPYVVTGRGALDFRENVFFRMIADGRQINLDRLEENVEADGTRSLEQRIEVVRSVIDRIPVPPFNGEIDAMLPAVVAGDTFIREVKARLRPFGRGWEVRTFSSIFPGNTQVEAAGRVGVGEEFGFTGKLLVASRQPSGLAAWISGDVDPQIRRLNLFGFSSDVVLSQRQSVFDNLELRMDDAVMRGKLQRLAPVDGRSALIVDLQGNRINLQDLQALYSLARERDGESLTSHDLNFRIAAARFETEFNGVPIRVSDLESQVRVAGGNVSIEDLRAGDLYGLQVESQGRLERALDQPNGNLKLNVRGVNAQPFLQFLAKFGLRHPVLAALQRDPALTADTALDLEIDTRSRDTGAKGQLLVAGTFGGTTVNSRFGFDGSPGDLAALGLDVDATLSNPSPAVMMQQLAVETLPSELVGDGPGPVTLKTFLQGSAAKGFEARVSATGHDTTVSGVGKVEVEGGHLHARLSSTVGSGNIAPYLVLAGVQLPMLNVDTVMPVSLRFDFANTDQTVSMGGLEGQVMGTAVSGNLDYQHSGLQRPRLSGALVLGSLPVSFLSDSVFGFTDFLSQAEVLDRGEREFGKPVFAGRDASLQVTAREFITGLGFTGKDATGKLVILDGALDFNDISFEALDGRFEGGLALRNVDGLVLGQLRYNLQGADFAQVAGLGTATRHATGTISLSGSAEASGRTIGAMLSNLSGNGVMVLDKMEVEGFEPEILHAILAEADRDGFEIAPDTVREVVEASALAGGFSVDRLDMPFSITRGNARVRNLGINLETAQLNNDISISLADGSVAANSVLTLRPGRREKIDGADPVIGFAWQGPASNASLEIDTGLLEGYLSLRAYEASQRRIETLEAQVIEKQRILRLVSLSYAREQYRIREAEKARLLLEQQMQNAAELESRRMEEMGRQLRMQREWLAEQARLEAERQAEEARLEAERKAEEARLEAERIEEEARQSAAAEAARRREEEARRRAEEAQKPRQPSFGERLIRDIEEFLQFN